MIATLTPALAADAYIPIRIMRVAGGVIATYSPEQVDRTSAWQILTDLLGQLCDVTPAWAVTL